MIRYYIMLFSKTLTSNGVIFDLDELNNRLLLYSILQPTSTKYNNARFCMSTCN